MDYPLCRHTVTIYRASPGLWQRVVADGCFCTWTARQKRDITGDGSRREFFLVLPGELGTVSPGDWIVEGEGPTELAHPSQVPGAEQVKWTKHMRDPGSFGVPGRLLHTEAGNN